MNDEELPIWNAIRRADERFEKAGDTGTKCWMRDYFLPSLEEHGLEVVPKGTLLQNDELRRALKEAVDVPDYVRRTVHHPPAVTIRPDGLAMLERVEIHLKAIESRLTEKRKDAIALLCGCSTDGPCGYHAKKEIR